MTLLNEALANSNQQPIYTPTQIDTYRNATDRITYPNHDHLTDVFQTVYTQNHYLNMSGGTANSNYSLGLGFTDQPGIFIGNNYKKYTLNLGLSSRINKRISFGGNFQFRYGNKTNPPQGSGDQFLSASSQTPLYLPQLPDGRYTDKAYNLEGPNKNYVAIVKENILARTQDYYMQGNLSLDVDIINGLKWENRAGINYGNTKFKVFRPANVPVYLYSTGAYSRNLDVGNPGLTATQSDNIYYTIYSQFTYRKSFGSHTLSALAGAQEEDNQASNLSGTRLQYPTNYLQELDAGPVSGMTNSGASSEWAIRSLYSSANYDYKDKYLFGASIRRDGTSRLPAASRHGIFYSVSGGWRISKENFLRDVTWLNDLKLRVSYGELGNQNIGIYPYQPVLSSSVYIFGNTTSTGFAANQLVDPNLTWETTQVFDLGLDLTAFNNRLTISADYFDKYTFGILSAPLLPLYVGLNAPTINRGAVRNKGFEFVAQYRDRIGKDFTYNIGGNIQGYKNVLEKFGTRSIGGNSIREEGHELDQYYLYIWDGIFQSQDEIAKSPKQLTTVTPGDPKYRDVNGDGKVDANDRTYVNGKYPLFTFSGNLGASYRRFDISIQVYGSARQKRYVNGTGIDPFNNTMPQLQWFNRWTPSNPTNDLPKLYTSNYQPVVSYASTYYLKDASFVRIKNVQFGYTLPANLLQRIGMQSARLFFTGDNLLTFSKYPGLDPERTGDGGYLVYPQVQSFTFGASINF
jgi:TonB-linked SusC/RagA family outer membrane protein